MFYIILGNLLFGMILLLFDFDNNIIITFFAERIKSNKNI